jgi:hypothetical protein
MSIEIFQQSVVKFVIMFVLDHNVCINFFSENQYGVKYELQHEFLFRIMLIMVLGDRQVAKINIHKVFINQ